MKETTEEILSVVDQNSQSLKELGVRKLGLFGSFARGDDSRESDLDFLIELDEKTFDAYMDVKFMLEDLFHRPVDLVLVDTIKPTLRKQILEEAIYAPKL